MSVEDMRGQGDPTSLSEFKSKKADLERHPASVSKLQYRGPYGYGSGSPKGVDQLLEQQRSGNFLKEVYEREGRQLPEPETTTPSKVLPFSRKPQP